MKRCPQCGAAFGEDNSFCLNDGTVLVSEIQMPSVGSGDQPTPVLPRAAPAAIMSAPARWPFVLIGLLAAVVLGLGGVLLLRPAADGSDNKWQSVTETVRPAANDAANTPTSANKPPTNSPITVPPVSPSGSWHGNWSTSSGAYYKFDLDLNESGGSISGQINWTMVRTPYPDRQSKIGSSAIEYVSGRFDPNTRLLTMHGTSESDPNNMLVLLDQYRLNLSPDGRTLNGSARNGGKWNGRITLSK